MRIKDFNIQVGEIIFKGTDIIEYDGLQEITAEYELTKNATGNGVIVTGWYMPEREISITARISRYNADDTLRYFKANKTLKMIIGSRRINVIVEDAKINWALGFYNEPRLELSLIAPDPYFYDVSDFGRNLAGVYPQFGFPWTYSPDKPISFGYYEFTDKTVFENDGDNEVGIKVKMEATGSVKNVKFENLTTGQFVGVNVDLVEGDVLEISTVSNNDDTPYIRLNGEDIFDQIDRMSTFFKLATGDNFLQYSAESGSTEMNVYLYYSPKYANGLEDIYDN